MCMLFNKDKKPSYIRLCYKTGRAGHHLPIDEFLLYPQGCVSKEKVRQAFLNSENDFDFELDATMATKCGVQGVKHRMKRLNHSKTICINPGCDAYC